MSGLPTDPVAAGGLSPEQIVAQRESERAGRDRGADSYLERLRAMRGAFRFESEVRTLVHHVAPRTGQSVLDAGAGVGRFAIEIAPRVARLVCVDLSPRTLEVLAARARERGLANIETHACDLASIPVSLGPFDTVYCSEVFQHMPSHDEHLAALTRMRALLKPGGRCLINVVCWNRRAGPIKAGHVGEGEQRMYWHRFTADELRGLMQEAGFTRVTLHGITVLPGTLSRRMPVAMAFIETWLSRAPALAGAGRLVLAVGWVE